MKILTKILGDYNEKYLKSIQPLVVKINSLEPEFEKFSDQDLKVKTLEFKERLGKGETLNDLLPEAFALVREVGKRTLGQRHFDVQLIGGIVLHQGKIAEMKTGEGKTLAATLPLYLNTLEEKGCHLVTVNDYLARRDTVWMGQIYHLLGISVGCIVHEAAYLYDPTYQAEKSQTPLIAKQLQGAKRLVRMTNDQTPKENKFPTGQANPKFPARLASQGEAGGQIPNGRDKERDLVGGFRVIESYLRPCSRKEAYLADITYGTNNEFGFDYLRDNMVYSLDQQVQRGFNFAIIDEVDSILIDEARTPLIISAPDIESSKWYLEFAKIIPRLKEPAEGGREVGRLESRADYEIDEKMRAVTLTEDGINKIEKILGYENIYEEKGIRYLHHLEQALRAQALFKRDRDYVVKDGKVIIIDEFTGRLLPGRRWSGGLHQAIEAKEGVLVQPESLTLAAITFQNYFRLYKKLAGMTGTALTSAEEFDKVYNLDVISVPTNKPMIRVDLADRIYKTENGKFLAIVEEIKERYQRGQPVLVGTRSVERNEYLGKLLEREGIPHQILNAKHHEREGQIIAQAGELKAVTVATNMAGRGVDIILGGNPQNPGEAKKVIELGGLHIVGTERHEARRIDNQLRGRGGRQGDPGSSQFFFSLEDELLRVFGGDKIKSLMSILKIPEDQPIEANLVSKAIEEAQSKIEGFNFDLRKHVLEYDDVLNKHREVVYKKRLELLQVEDLKLKILEMAKEQGFSEKDYQEKEKELGKENMREIEKIVALRTLDFLWMNHLEEMEHLRDSVRLRAYGQQDPLVEYKNEGHKMFQNLLRMFEANLVQTIFRAQISPRSTQPSFVSQPIPAQKNPQKVGRNDPCPCGSGKKYKKCCLLK